MHSCIQSVVSAELNNLSMIKDKHSCLKARADGRSLDGVVDEFNLLFMSFELCLILSDPPTDLITMDFDNFN